MARRYCFWRCPDGRPFKGKDDRYAPSTTLSQYGLDAKVNPDGSVSRKSWGIDQEWAVASHVIVLDENDDELNDHDTHSLIHKSLQEELRASGGATALSPAKVLQRADRLAAALFRKAPNPFVVVTTASLAELPVSTMKVKGCTIRSSSHRSKRFPIPAALKEPAGEYHFASYLQPTRYCTLSIRVHARTPSEAADRGIEAFDLARSLWTLNATFRESRFHMGLREPGSVGRIFLGPLHTLHTPDGASVDNLFWYEHHWNGEQKLFRPNDWKALEQTRRWGLSAIARSPYRRELEQLMVRYVNAIDYTSHDEAFLRLWGVLEKLTDTVGAQYDETIRRALRIFQSKARAKETLGHLRMWRNRLVHSGKSGANSIQTIYMIKQFIDPHLIRLINNTFGVNSLKEYGEFLGLPSDGKILRSRIVQLRRALRIASDNSKE